MLRKVFTGSGECATVEPILGLPMPAWSLLWFVALGALALLAAWRAPRVVALPSGRLA
jgi:disulfide bond formation protein DsbB